jgi:hypothetical protein
LHDARHIGFGKKAEQINAARRHVGVGGKGDHRDVARARHLADDADGLREQRAEDQFAAFVDRLLGRKPRTIGRAGVILDQKLDIRGVEFGERHFGGVAHGLTGDAGIPASRQRQNERNPHLAGAKRRLRHRRPGWGLGR